MNLTQLIEEQKKEARKKYKAPDADYCVFGYKELDTTLTTTLTKGYELALEEVEKLRKDEVKWEKAKYDVKSVEAVCYNRAIDDVLKLKSLAHLKETI